jgi:hypothetical protein
MKKYFLKILASSSALAVGTCLPSVGSVINLSNDGAEAASASQSALGGYTYTTDVRAGTVSLDYSVLTPASTALPVIGSDVAGPQPEFSLGAAPTTAAPTIITTSVVSQPGSFLGGAPTGSAPIPGVVTTSAVSGQGSFLGDAPLVAASVPSVIMSSVGSEPDSSLGDAPTPGVVQEQSVPMASGFNSSQIFFSLDDAPVISAIPEPKSLVAMTLMLAPVGFRTWRNLRKRTKA